MRAQAHSRAERGTSCCLAGTCECGGPYKHDAEINHRVVQAIKDDKRLRDTAVWVTTTRGFVTLAGMRAQRNAEERAGAPRQSASRRRHRMERGDGSATGALAAAAFSAEGAPGEGAGDRSERWPTLERPQQQRGDRDGQ